MGRLFHPSGAFDQTRAIVFLCALIFGSVCGTVHAIDDIPEGGFRWIQGYGGNEPTAGFRVDGRLRIEAPDEPQSVSINLSSGRIDVGTTGEILVQYGPGGSRFINGDLVNEGLVTLKSVLLFSRDGAEWVNRGVIEAATDTKSPYISVKFLVWWFEIWDSLTWPERENPWMRSERHLWWPGCSVPNLPVPGANGF